MTVSAQTAARAIRRLQDGEELARTDIALAFLWILEEDTPAGDVAWGALLAALHTRKATTAELCGLVDAILAYDPELAQQLSNKETVSTEKRVIAVTGSGKETFKTFNISTAAAFVAASHPGLCVIKPTGRATSANTGASDVLETLGLRLPTSLAEVAGLAAATDVGVFDYHLVAPRYGPRYEGRFHHLHPLSHVTPWLLIPFNLDGIVFGVAESRVGLAASVMESYEVPRGAVVSTSFGKVGRIDEYAHFGTSTLATFGVDDRTELVRQDRGVPTELSELEQSTSHRKNADLLLGVLGGELSRIAHDIVCANAGLILSVAGLSESLELGAAMADEFIRSGQALSRLDACRRSSQHLPTR